MSSAVPNVCVLLQKADSSKSKVTRGLGFKMNNKIAPVALGKGLHGAEILRRSKRFRADLGNGGRI